ncbi:hypothetical protein M8C21_016686, partial [Ambrosia artemisiifolia]
MLPRGDNHMGCQEEIVEAERKKEDERLWKDKEEVEAKARADEALKRAGGGQKRADDAARKEMMKATPAGGAGDGKGILGQKDSTSSGPQGRGTFGSTSMKDPSKGLAKTTHIALVLVARYPELATTIPSDNVDAPLMAIARKADAFESGCRLNFFVSLIYIYVHLKSKNPVSNKKPRKMNLFSSVLKEISLLVWKVIVPHVTHIQKLKLDYHQALALVKCLCQEISALNLQSNSIHYSGPIIEAASNGAYKVVQEIADTFPQAIWYSDKSGYFMIQLAILHRCEKVYNLTYQMSDHKHFHKTLKDTYNNNLLHLAGKLAPPQKLNLVSGAALQMQRELQCFKEVETFVHPKYKTEKNSFDQTPEMLFSTEHKKLVRDGEEWMKKTTDSYTVIAGLITTIVFAAAITVPGGNSGDTGNPLYAKELSFLIFAVADTISLFTSTTSLLLFLSILMARYAEQDFLFTLPSRLIMGLATLFLSTTSMMIAFGASLYLLFRQGKEWILIPIAALSCLPITCFVTLQFPLLAELIS